MPTPDHYATLGVDRDATTEQIRAAYRRRAQLLHPDRHAHNPDLAAEANRATSDLNAAYGVLADPARRAEYDRETNPHPPPSSPPPRAASAAHEPPSSPLSPSDNKVGAVTYWVPGPQPLPPLAVLTPAVATAVITGTGAVTVLVTAATGRSTFDTPVTVGLLLAGMFTVAAALIAHRLADLTLLRDEHTVALGTNGGRGPWALTAATVAHATARGLLATFVLLTATVPLTVTARRATAAGTDGWLPAVVAVSTVAALLTVVALTRGIDAHRLRCATCGTPTRAALRDEPAVRRCCLPAAKEMIDRMWAAATAAGHDPTPTGRSGEQRCSCGNRAADSRCCLDAAVSEQERLRPFAHRTRPG